MADKVAEAIARELFSDGSKLTPAQREANEISIAATADSIASTPEYKELVEAARDMSTDSWAISTMRVKAERLRKALEGGR